MLKIKSIPAFLLFILLIFHSCDDTKNPVDSSKSFTGISYTDENGIITKDDTNDWQPRITFPLPDLLSSEPAYPNPTNNTITIIYGLAKQADVLIEIYREPGEVIKTLANEPLTAGKYTIIWDTKDNDGNDVSNGIFRVKIVAESNKVEIYETYGDVEVKR